MIILSELSDLICKNGLNLTSVFVIITLCDYFNKRRAHHLIIFPHKNVKFSIVTF